VQPHHAGWPDRNVPTGVRKPGQALADVTMRSRDRFARAYEAPKLRSARAMCLWLGAVLASCALEPLPDIGAATPPSALVPAGVIDQRARFREIFCALSQDHGADLPDHRPCEQALHRLPGEGPASGQPVNLGPARLRLRLMIVPGLVAQCFGELALPLRLAARHVEQLGYGVTWIDVDGLSSSARNATEIRAAILDTPVAAEQPIVLLGHSKGASDALEASADPAVAERVAALVSLSGSVNGSPLVDRAPAGLFAVLGYLPGLACGPGDGGGLESLRPSTRTDWLATHPGVPAIGSYSVVSYAERSQISAVLRPWHDALSPIDPRNDGQLLLYDQILPASRLLAFINADHWAGAMPIARDSVLGAAFADHNAFPREILLEAILKQIEEDLLDADRSSLERAIPPAPSGE
jgi:hypothetical protein